MNIGVGILGGTGYGAGELLRLCALHPGVDVVSVTSRQPGRIHEAHPHLRGFYGDQFEAEMNVGALSSYENAVVFSALPHGVSGQTLLELFEDVDEGSIKIIDLSGDWRLQSPQLHGEHYPHSPLAEDTRKTFVYGLSELYREQITQATRVANPGCLATASALALAPLGSLKPVGQIAVDAKTGSSGSGKDPKASTHHPTRHGNFRAYKPLAHQHEPEFRQAVEAQFPDGLPPTSFIAQSLPISRGIFVTVHAELEEEISGDALLEHLDNFYDASPFVRVLPQLPEIGTVVGTNFCDMSGAARGNQIIVCAALDNLGKGMAGAAIQNMNLMFGIEETAGLMHPALGPS